MSKELQMIQMILEKGNAKFWHTRLRSEITYNNFDLTFCVEDKNGYNTMRSCVSDLELEKPKSVYNQLTDALFDTEESIDTYERLAKIKKLVKQHEDFLREK